MKRAILFILLLSSALAIAPINPGDLNGDSVVNIQDVLLISGCLGQNAATCQSGKADPNNDGVVNLFDFVHVSQRWGQTYSTGPDLTPPTLTIITPEDNEVFPSGTTSVSIQVTTDEPATCKHHGQNVAYAQMSNTFQGAGTTTHTSGTGNLADGDTRTRYISCQDTAGNVMANPAIITFSVATSSPAVCGNAITESSEQCDLGAANGACPATCSATCTTNSCGPAAVCGNGVVESGEACDGANLNGKTCTSLGYTGGTLSCSGSCQFVTSSCTAPPPSSQHPNEPVGFTGLSDRAFDAKIEKGWGDRGDAAFSIVQMNAPASPLNVGQAKFNSGGTGGTGPIMTGYGISGNYKRLYVSFWVQLSPNWEPHPSGVNKIFHIWIDGSNKVYLSSQGTTTSNMKAQIRFQGMGVQTPGQGFPSWNGAPNVNSQAASILPGQWHHWEFLLETNTPGVPDGTARWWIDNTLVGNYTNVGYIGAAGSPYWTNVVWNPTWGGGGGTRAQTFYMWMDQAYISVAP